MKPRTDAYLIVFRLTIWLLIGAMLAGVVYSLILRRQLPYVEITYKPVLDTLVEAKRYDEAIERLQEADRIEIESVRHGKIQAEIARLAILAENYDAHIAATLELIRMGGDEVQLNNDLAASYLARGKDGDLQRALKHSQRALELNPNYAPAICNLGFVYAAQNDREKAAAYFQRALQIHPNLPQALYGLERLQRGPTP